MDDGKLQFRVIDKSKDEIKTEVVVGGLIKSNKGVNLPDVVLNTSPLTSNLPFPTTNHPSNNQQNKQKAILDLGELQL